MSDASPNRLAGPLAGAVLRAGAIALGLMWVVAAVSKTVAPLEPWEFAIRTLGTKGEAPAWLALALGTAAGIEVALGVAMILGAVRGFLLSSVMLAVATVALLKVRHDHGGVIPCGCFSVFATSSVEGAIVRNAVLIALTVVFAIAAILRRRALASAS